MKLFTLLITVIIFLNFSVPHRGIQRNRLVGAWEKISAPNITTFIYSEKHFAATTYSIEERKFVGTRGGSWRIEKNKLIEVHEFNTLNPDQIGKAVISEIDIKKDKLIIRSKEKSEEYTSVDTGSPGKLAGAWLITGRMNGGQIQKATPGSRRTMKILSGKRFQWIAYDKDTKEFFGTGGGTYSTENGKYKENIEFFSRDNSRVGMSLEFDYALKDGNWRHQGLSSKGDPIDEVWTKREKLDVLSLTFDVGSFPPFLFPYNTLLFF